VARGTEVLEESGTCLITPTRHPLLYTAYTRTSLSVAVKTLFCSK